MPSLSFFPLPSIPEPTPVLSSPVSNPVPGLIRYYPEIRTPATPRSSESRTIS
jgi:hypothetical protein